MANRLFVSGDCHYDVDIKKLNTKNFPDQKNLDRDDVVVLMGDIALCWDGGRQDKYIQKWHENKNYSTFCVRGNHDAVPVIKTFPVVEKYGGKVYQITPHVCYAMTGEIYNICGYTCLVINGADSHDREIRTEGKDWWREERISLEDINRAYRNLEKVNFKVDFIFSHTGGSFNTKMINLKFEPTESDKMLDYILRDTIFKCHYYAHYHIDTFTDYKSHCLFNNVYEIIDGKELLVRPREF